MHLKLIRFTLLLSFVLTPAAQGATWTWDGQSTNSPAWDETTNWSGGSIPVSASGTDLIFADSPLQAASNNLGTFSLHNLTFTGTSSKAIFGDPLQLYGSIVNAGVGAGYLFAPILLGADASIDARQGDLLILSNVVNNGHTLTLEGARPVYLYGAVSGAGGLTVDNSGMAFLAASNSYTGATRVNHGYLNAMDHSLWGTTSLVVQGSSTASVSYTSDLFHGQSQNRQALVTGSNALLLLNSGGLTMSGVSNTITVTNGGRIAGSMLAVGYDSASAGNALVVNGHGSRVDLDSQLLMGTGTASRLTVQNGGVVWAPSIYMFGSNHYALVTGAGSIVSGAQMIVGGVGGGHDTLAVEQGGRVQMSQIGLSGDQSAIRVSGAGSALESAYVTVGAMGSTPDARVAVSNGGQLNVYSIQGTSYASNTLFTVTGTGSSAGMTGGNISFYNTTHIEVRDGAKLQGSLQLAGNSNEVIASGAGTTMTSGMAHAISGADNRLAVSNGAVLSAAVLNVSGERNTVIFDGSGTGVSLPGGLNLSSSSGVLRVTGGATLTGNLGLDTTADVLFSGPGTRISGSITPFTSYGGGGSLTVSDGACVAGTQAVVYVPLTITGAGTTWSNSSTLYTYSSLNLTDGARLDADGTMVNGYGWSTTLVSGAGTVWSNRSGMSVQGQSLKVLDGARIDAGPGAQLNCVTVLVDGAGTKINSAGTMVLGSQYTGETAIRNGAQVRANMVQLMSTTTRVEGAGSRVTAQGNLVLLGNKLLVLDGAEILSATSYVANGISDIEIGGAGSVWSNSGDLHLGDLSYQSTLLVRDGGRLYSGSTFLGTNTIDSMNLVTITGTGSLWRVNGDLVTDSMAGRSNVVRIENGAAMISRNVLLGQTYSNAGVGRTELIVDSATFSNSGTLVVGGDTTDNLVEFSGGTKAYSGSATLGNGANAYGNSVVVADTGTVWNVGTLTVGADGWYSAVAASNGGVINAGTVSIGGPGQSGANGQVKVLAGSELHASSIEVGGGNNWGNQLNISGGVVSADSVAIRSGGAVTLDDGTLTAGYLSKTSSMYGSFTFNSGMLNVSSTKYVRTVAWGVGDGTQSATLNLVGGQSNRHEFSAGLIIKPNAYLVGEGTIVGDVEIDGTLSPGHSAGAITVDGNLTLDDSATTLMQVFGTNSLDYDRMIADSVSYGGTLVVSFVSFTPSNGMVFQLFDAGTSSGSFSATNSGAYVQGVFDSLTGEFLVTNVIPEASTLSLLMMGLAWLRRSTLRRPRTARARNG